jgi:hypothetical protein
MAKRRSTRQGDAGREERPVEIPMTDLGWSEEENDRDGEAAATRDIHAAGTPGGGSASGGLAGTNVGDGSPDGVDLEDALGSGVLDNEGEDEDQPPYAGPSGGAVGGTPAEKRAKGGHPRPRQGKG